MEYIILDIFIFWTIIGAIIVKAMSEKFPERIKDCNFKFYLFCFIFGPVGWCIICIMIALEIYTFFEKFNIDFYKKK